MTLRSDKGFCWIATIQLLRSSAVKFRRQNVFSLDSFEFIKYTGFIKKKFKYKKYKTFSMKNKGYWDVKTDLCKPYLQLITLPLFSFKEMRKVLCFGNFWNFDKFTLKGKANNGNKKLTRALSRKSKTQCLLFTLTIAEN